MSDYIGNSTDPDDILRRLRYADLLLSDTDYTQVSLVIEQLAARQIAVQLEYERYRSLGKNPGPFEVFDETRTNHLLPVALLDHWNAKGRAWCVTPWGINGRVLIGDVLEEGAILDHLKLHKALRDDISDADALVTIRYALIDADSAVSKSVANHYDAHATIVGWIQGIAWPMGFGYRRAARYI